MSYPQITEYQAAVQNPAYAFLDRALKQGALRENALGLPLVLSGGFALTYTVTAAQRKYAVRCFHREIPEIERKYAAISASLKSLQSGYFVGFEFQNEGIVVQQKKFPIVKMDWVEGDPLGIWLDKEFGNDARVEELRKQFSQLSQFLEQKGIAHGDIQNGNVLVAGGKLKLIDYDGMFVPSLPPGNGSELGHRHFQHPQRGASSYGPKMDRFSFITVDLSLRALSRDKSLYKRFREGGETIIFKANDFADPQNSEVFRILLRDPTLNASARNFATICEAPISDVPTLEDFCAGRNIPSARKPIVTTPTTASPPKPARYMSAFPVVDATDFQQGAKHIGDKVEIVGKIVEVRPGSGRRGQYIFINFGPWRGKIIKLAIWSQGISALKEKPSKSWVGRWVSVTGLIDDPYTSRRFKYTHLSVTVEQDGQIQFITEADARFRLGASSVSAPSNPPQGTTVEQPTKKPITTPKPPKTGASGRPKTTNQDILKTYLGKGATPPTYPPHVGTTIHAPQPIQKSSPNQAMPPPVHAPGTREWTGYCFFGALIAFGILVRMLGGPVGERPTDVGTNAKTESNIPASPPKHSDVKRVPPLDTPSRNDALSAASDKRVKMPTPDIVQAPKATVPSDWLTSGPSIAPGASPSSGKTKPPLPDPHSSPLVVTPAAPSPQSEQTPSIPSADPTSIEQQKNGAPPTRELSLNAFEIQKRLAELGYLEGAPSGIWGSRSNDALVAFRAKNGLPGDGWDSEAETLLFGSSAIRAVPRRLSFVGAWSPNQASCSPSAPILITEKRAISNGGTCEFHTVAQVESGWRIQAECSGEERKWTSDISLSIKGSSLIWSSQKGTAIYVRCRSSSRTPN